ncbi:hypothetical protein BWI92_25650 [Flectobacillus sp. BAB-3569]|nr:hypothetical protein BWI92_25650 [Flectobacillus sp. BAB-3569]
MRLLPKQIWKEEFQYYSDKSVDGLKSEIQQLFDKTNGWNFSVNLTGEFISEYEFKMTPKWQFAVIKSFEREVSYLNGQIFSDEFKRTRVTFTVRPNSILLIFFFVFPLFGIFALTTDNINGDINETRIVGAVFTFAVPALMLLFGHFAKQGIKNRFVKTFDLSPVV